jgi:predicted nucleic acid-binding protein
VIVLDASAAVEWLLGRPGADRVAELLRDPTVTMHAPSILTVEVAAAMRGLVRGGHASAARAGQALTYLSAAGIETYDPGEFIERIWEWRDNLTPYDAAYAVIAEALGATLVTADRRLAAAPGLRMPIEVVGRG